MANYVLVDADQLDADMTSVADKIRAKGGTSEKLEWPAGYEAAVEAISTGVTVQEATGTFTTNTGGTATVTCGFQPDLVVVTKNETSTENDTYVAAFPFKDFTSKKIDVPMWTTSSSGYVYDLYPTQTTTGFSVTVEMWDESWELSTVKNTSFNYTAYKFTE